MDALKVYDQAAADADYLLGLGLLLVVFGVIAGINSTIKRWKTRGKVKVIEGKEAKRIRYNYQQRVLSEKVCDVVTQMCAYNYCTVDEAQRWYDRLGHAGLPHLLPRKMGQSRVSFLKQCISLRLKTLDWRPVRIPGGDPVQYVAPAKAADDAPYGGSKLRALKPRTTAAA